MDFQITGNPDYGELTVALAAGERLLCESGAMSRMSQEMDLKGRTLGGFFGALGRKLFGGESFFVGEYSSPHGGWLTLSPALPGVVLSHDCSEAPLILSAGSFLACEPGVRLRTRFGGLRYMFSGKGGFLLRAEGEGQVFFNSYGAVIEKQVDGTFTVDTGHLLAWDPQLEYRIAGMGGVKATLFSGEGLVMKLSGRGRVFLQTRTLQETASYLSPFCLG